MGILIVPVLITLLAVPVDHAGARQLDDFGRLQCAAGHAVFVADGEGVERRLKLVRVDGDSAIFMAGENEVVLHRSTITNVDRAKDPSWDGALKGAVFGALVAALLRGEVSGNSGSFYLSGIGTYTALGYLVDAGITNRQPLYRAARTSVAKPVPFAPTLSFSFRF